MTLFVNTYSNSVLLSSCFHRNMSYSAPIGVCECGNAWGENMDCGTCELCCETICAECAEDEAVDNLVCTLCWCMIRNKHMSEESAKRSCACATPKSKNRQVCKPCRGVSVSDKTLLAYELRKRNTSRAEAVKEFMAGPAFEDHWAERKAWGQKARAKDRSRSREQSDESTEDDADK